MTDHETLAANVVEAAKRLKCNCWSSINDRTYLAKALDALEACPCPKCSPSRCDPPPNIRHFSQHWLRDETGTEFKVAMWSIGDWVMPSGDKRSPEDVYRMGWRYLGPALPPKKAEPVAPWECWPPATTDKTRISEHTLARDDNYEHRISATWLPGSKEWLLAGGSYVSPEKAAAMGWRYHHAGTGPDPKPEITDKQIITEYQRFSMANVMRPENAVRFAREIIAMVTK